MRRLLRWVRLLFAFLQGFLGLYRGRKGRKRRKERARREARRDERPARRDDHPASRDDRDAEPARPGRTRRRVGPERVVARLVEVLPRFDHPGPWHPAEAVRVEDGRVALDLHGLTEADAVDVVEAALAEVGGGVPVRLITGHGRDRPAGHSRIRVALVDVLGDRDDVVIDDLALHRRHAESDDRIGHMDVMVG